MLDAAAEALETTARWKVAKTRMPTPLLARFGQRDGLSAKRQTENDESNSASHQ